MRAFIFLVLLLLGRPARMAGATYVVAQRNSNATDEGSGSEDHPWKTISKAARMVVPGDDVLIRDGVYREQVVISRAGTQSGPIRFEAAPWAQVVLTGADRLSGWERTPGGLPVYRVAWPHRFISWSSHMTHPDDEYHRLIGRCEQVMIDNYLLHQVSDTNQLAPGSFCADPSHQSLYVWDYANRDVNKVLAEASTRPEIVRVEGAHVLLKGLRFRFAANMAQHGAVVLAGAYDQLEDCVAEAMNSSGATFSAPYQVVRRCVFRDNGQIGFGANGAHDLLLSECVVENNNTKGFDRGWEAGGDKLVLCRDAVIERSRFVRNRGNGIWFDIGNEHCTVRQCLIADNEDSGIFYEISFALQAHDNVITGNGFAATPGAWGAQAGISLSSSPDCVVERNLIVGNREGFNFREQSRTTPRIGQRAESPIWNQNQRVRHNIIAFNRDAQIWGWFDMKDGRHWPAEGRVEPKPGASASASMPSSAAQPAALSLEQLNLRFERNIYFAEAGQGWFQWGVPWGRHQSYASLAEFQSGLHIDERGSAVRPDFLDPAARDYRVNTATSDKIRDNYPQGPVPGVLLGVRL